MFNLRRLEDRIVLDGAAMTEALDEIQEQHQHDLEMHFQALEAHNAQDWDYGLDIDEPLYLADGFDAPESADEGLRVLVVSSDIADADDLADAAKDGVLVVRHDASDNIEDLAASINKALGSNGADTIAFAAHSGADFFDLDALDTDNYQKFWSGVGNLLADDGRIDLLGCNVIDGDEGEQLVAELEKLTGANVAASTDATGNEAYGGDWVLESDGVDIQGTYFDADRLENFDGVLENAAPVVVNEIDDQTVNQGEEFVYTIPADTFSDADNDDLTYWSFSWHHPDWMSFDGAQTLTGTPDTQDDVGTWNVTVVATDPYYAAVGDTFQVRVNDVQEYPVILSQIGTIPVDQKSPLNFVIPDGTFDDPDGDDFTYSLQEQPTWMALEGATLTGTPAYQTDVKTTTIKLVATDSTGLATAMYIDVTVNDTNDAPAVANPIPDMTLEQGEEFIYTVPEDTFSDPDGDELTYWSLSWNHPSWMSFDAATGTFTGTPSNQDDVGTETVTVSVTDPSYAGIADDFTVMVTDVNDPPETMMDIADVEIEQYESTTFSVVANFEDPDPEDTVRYHAEITLADNSTKILTEDDTYWMYLDPNTGEFTINPTSEDHVNGTPWTVEVYAVDHDEDRSLEALTFDVTVTDFNDDPVLVGTPIVNPAPVLQNETIPFDISDYFEDPEGEDLKFWSMSWQKPDWVTLDQTTGVFTIAPTEDDAVVVGTHNITVSATDPGYKGVATTFQVTVQNFPDYPPEIFNIDGETLMYEESDGPVTLDQGADAFISDSDSANFDGGQLTVQITDGLNAAEDQLSIADGGGIYFGTDDFVTYNGEQIGVVTGNDTGTLTIDLTANADTAAVGQLLRNITYENTDEATPAVGVRTVQIDFEDGSGGTAATSEMSIDVSAVNTAPLHENLAGDIQVYAEGDGPVLIDPQGDAIITDADSPDFNGGFLEVKISDGYRDGDVLNSTMGMDELGTLTNPTPNTWRIDFENGVTPTNVENFIHTITYENTNTGNPPEGERKIRLVLNDGDGGTTVIDPTVDVGGINDAPVITDDVAVQDFVEGDGPVIVDVGTAAMVSDVDSPDFDGGKLVVQITGDTFVAAEDKLSINSQGNMGYEISFDGTTVRYSNAPFATVTEPSPGVLEISFINEDATPEAVQALIRNITYENTSADNPTESERTIEFQLWDGDRGDAPHVNESAPVEMKVSVHPVNDPSVITGFEHNLDFVEGDDALVLDADSNALVADVDSPNFNKGVLTVQITDGAVTSEDMLEIRAGGGLGVAPGNLTYNGDSIATTEDSGTASMTIRFDSDHATPEAVSAVLQNITYGNSDSESPTTGVRTIEFQLNDGDGTEFGGLGIPDSDPVTMTVTVNEDNDPPVLANVSTDAFYYEDTSPGVTADPIFIDEGQAATVSDIDNENFDGGKLVVEITDNYLAAEDALSIKNDPTEGPDRIGFDGKNVTYNFKTFGTVTGDESGTLTVTFNENADTGAVAELIKNVTYQNTNHEDPNETDRIVSLTMWDGNGFDAASSMTQDVTVHVQGHPDDPVISNLGTDEVDYVEDAEPVLLDVDGNALVTDVDSTAFAGGQLKAEIVEGGDTTEDMLTISTDSGVINYHTDGAVSCMDGGGNDILIGWAEFSGGNLLTVNLTDDANEDNVSALIQNIAYSNTDVEDLTEGPRHIKFTLRDAPDNGNPDDVPGQSEPVSVTVNVGDANDAPTIENLNGDNFEYQETEGAVLVDQTAAPFSAAYVTDVDGGGENFDGGNLTVTIDGFVAGEDTISVNTDGGHLDIYNEKYITYDSVQIGTITFDAVNGIWDVELTADADQTTVSELVQNIEYNNTDSYSPTAGERTLRFTLSDGQAASGPYNVTLDVLSPNDDPVISNIAGETFTYIEDSGPVTLDNSDASVRDVDGVDFDGGKLQVQIVDGLASTEDVLNIANGGGITTPDGGITVYYNGVKITQDVTFTPEDGLLNITLNEDASEDAVSQLLRNVSYENANTGNPVEGERQLRFGVWDGDGGSSGYSSMTVTVVGVNDAPAIANLDGDEVTYKEDGGGTAGAEYLDLGTNAVVTDADMTDFGSGTLKVQILDAYTDEDRLAVDGDTSGFNASLGTLTVNLTADDSATDVSALIQSIQYYNSDTGMPTVGQRTVEFTLNDGHGTEHGGMDEIVSTVTLNVEATNDPPVISGVGGTMLYLEGDGQVLLDPADGTNAVVTDVDSDDFDGGVLTVKIENGDPAEDVLTVRDEGYGPTRIGFDGANVFYGGASIGAASFNGGDGILTVTLNESADSVSVSSLVQNIMYENTDTDRPAEGVRNIGFSLFDGDGGTTMFTYMSVIVTGVNDAPVISNVGGDAVTFDEGDGTTNSQVLLDDGGNALVEDVDSDDFNSGQLTVTITNPEVTEDVLTIRDEGVGTGQIGLDGGSIVSYEGDVIGTTAYDGSVLTITFTSDDADADAVSALLQNISYYNTNTLDPTEGVRDIQFQLVDGDGTAFDGADTSAPVNVALTVNDLNDPPVIHDLDGDSLVYMESHGVKLLDNNLPFATVTDLDSPNFEGGHLQVFFDGGYSAGDDVLGVDHDGSDDGQIGVFGDVITYGEDQIGSADFDPVTGMLDITLFDDATTESVSALLQHISYENTDTVNPEGGLRTIRFSMSDGEGNQSANNTVIVRVEPDNSAPVIDNIDGSQTFYEGGDPLVVDADGDATVTDKEDDSFTRLTVQVIDSPDDTSAEDILSIQDEGNNPGQIAYDGVNISYGGIAIGTGGYSNIDGLLDISLDSAAADAEAVSALMQNITYDNGNEDNPAEGDRTIQFQVWDQNGASSNIDQMTISVVGVNDQPVIDNLNGDAVAFNEATGGAQGYSDVAVYLDAGSDAWVTDLDHTDFDGGHLRVEILDAEEGDRIYIPTDYTVTEDVTIDTSGNVVYNTTTIGTAEGGTSGFLDITFNAEADATGVSAVIRSIVYNTTTDASHAPVEGVRTVQFELWDGDGTEFGGVDGSGVKYDVTLTVDGCNDPPEFSGITDTHSVTFVEDSDPIRLADGTIFSLTDMDDDGFANGRLKIDFLAGSFDADDDVLSIADDDTNISFDTGEITYKSSADGEGTVIGTGTYTPGNNGLFDIAFNANADTESVSALLNAITYENIDTVSPITGVALGAERTIRFRFWDGDGDTGAHCSDSAGSAYMTVQIQGVNDAPIINNLDGDAVEYCENGWTNVEDATNHSILLDAGSDLSLSELDSATWGFSGGHLRIEVFGDGDTTDSDVLGISEGSLITLAGTVVSYDGARIGGMSQANFTTGSVLDITFDTGGGGSVGTSAVEALLSRISYANVDTIDPEAGTRTIRFELWDGEGTAFNGADGSGIFYDVHVDVQTVNDGPEFSDFNTASISYTEDDDNTVVSVFLQGGAEITDPDSDDFDGGKLVVEFVNATTGAVNGWTPDPANDRLSVLEGGGTGATGISVAGEIVFYEGDQIGSFSYSEDASALTVNLNENADETSVSALINSVAYSNLNTASPVEGWRSIRFQLTDGDGVAGCASGVDTSGWQYLSMYVHAVNDQPELHGISTEGAVTFCENNATGVGGETDIGVLLSPNGDFSLTDPDPDLGTPGVSDPTVTAWFSDATLSVKITGGLDSDDRLSIMSEAGEIAAGDELNFTGGAGLYSGGATVTYHGSDVASVEYDDGTGKLTISFDRPDSSHVDEEIMSDIMNHIVFSSADSLAPTEGLRTIRFGFSDGDGTVNWNGSDTATPAEMYLQVGGVNNAPVFTPGVGFGTDGITYNETVVYDDGAGVAFTTGKELIFDTTNINVTDVDNSTFDGARLTVQITGGLDDTEDVLSFSENGNLSIGGDNGFSGTITWDSKDLGNYVWSPATGLLTVDFTTSGMTGNDYSKAVSELIGSITYQNMDSQDPTDGTRTIRVVLTDAGEEGTAIGECAVGAQTVGINGITVNVEAVNDRPEIFNLDGDVSATFQVADSMDTTGGIFLDRYQNAYVEDVDSEYFSKMEVSILTKGNLGQDRLSIFSEGNGDDEVAYNNGTLTYDGEVIGQAAFAGSVLTVTFDEGEADADAVSAVIQNIVYQNTNTGNLATGDRSFRFVLWDEDGTNFSANNATGFSVDNIVTIHISDTNDAPSIENLDGDVVTFNEFTAVSDAVITNNWVVLDEDPTAAKATDPDGTSLAGGQLWIQIGDNDPEEDRLGFSEGGGLRIGHTHDADLDFVGNTYGTVSYGGTQLGEYTWNQDAGLLKIEFEAGTDISTQAVGALIQSVTYYNVDSEDPSLHDRKVSFVLWDGDPNDADPDNRGLSSDVSYVTVHVKPVNNAPDINNLDSDAAIFVEEQGPVILDNVNPSQVTVSDVDSDDFDGGHLKVEITGGLTSGDVLGIVSQGMAPNQIYYDGLNVFYSGEQIGYGTYADGTGTLDITLDEDANETSVSALIQQISYDSTDTENPAADNDLRTVRFTLSDGDNATSDPVEVTVGVMNVNDAPQIRNLDGDLLTFSEVDNGTASAGFLDVGQNAVVRDVDSDDFSGGSLTVTITNGIDDEDWLGINDLGAGNDVEIAKFVGDETTAATYTIEDSAGKVYATATWTSADQQLIIDMNSFADADTVSKLVQNITYANLNSDAPTEGDRNVQFQLDDGDGTAFGGFGESLSDVYNTTVRVEPVNDAPELNDLSGGHVYNETVFNGGHLQLDSDAAVIDVDSANFDGGTLTVNISGGYDNTEDRIGIEPGADFDFNDGENIFDAVTGDKIGSASFEPLTGAFTISLTEDATPDAVSTLIQNITYYNEDVDNPNEGTRTISFTLNDGDGEASLVSEVTVFVEEVNDAPEIQNVNGDEVTYVEDGDPVLLDVDLNAEVSDPDNEHFMETSTAGHLYVQLASGEVTTEDVLSILDDGGNSWDQIDVRDDIGAGSSVFYGNLKIGEVEFVNSTGILDVTLTANADEEAVSALIQHIQYENTAEGDPTAGDRRVDFWISDGANAEDHTFMSSEKSSVVVHVEAMNDPPVIENLDENDDFNYTEGDGLERIEQTGNVKVYDEDSDDFEDGVLTVQIANPVATEDELSVSSFGGIVMAGDNVTYHGSTIGTQSFDPNTGTLTVSLTEHAFADDGTRFSGVEALIEAVSYENTNLEDPAEGERVVQFTLTDDDGASSAVSEVLINVKGENDAPVIDNVDGDAVTFVEGTETVLLDVDGDASVTDVDTTSFGGGQLEVLAVGGTDNVLSVRDNGPIEVLDNGAVFYDDEQIGFANFVDVTSTLTVTLTDAADKEAVDALIASVEYGNSNTGDLADDTRTVRFRLWDGDNPAAGASGDFSAWSDVTVNLNAVNDPPVIHDLVDDEAVLYTEGAGKLILDRAEGAFSPARVTDVDDANFTGGQLQVEILGYVQGEDGLSINNEGGGTDQIGFSGIWGSTVEYEGNKIGTATWNDAHGVLNITLNQNADEEAVGQLIQNIAFENSNEMDPMEGNRTVRFSLLDGDASDDGKWSDPADVVVTVQDVNDPPVITNVDGDTQSYDEDDVDPVRLDSGLDAGVIDVDSSDFDGGRLEVVIDGGYDAGNDMLTIQNIAGEKVGYDGVYVTYDGAQIGTATYVNGTLSVNFNVGEPVGTEVAAEVIRSVSYYNRDMDDYLEGEYARTIRFTISDGDGNGQSEAVQMTLFVRPVNSAPEIHDLAGDTLTYVEGDGAVRVDQYLGDAVAASVTDGDSPDFDGGTLTVQVFGEGMDGVEDVLAINDEGMGIEQIGIDAGTNRVFFDGQEIGKYSYVANQQLMIVNFDNDADEESVTRLIQNITYENTDAIDPVGGERTIRFTLSDGDGATSENYDVFLDVVPTNDAPVIHNLEGDVIIYAETDGSPDRAMVIDTGGTVALDASVEDLDSAGYDKLTVQIVADGDTDEDVLWVQDEGAGAKDIGISEFGDLTYGGVDIGDADFDESNGLLTVTFNDNANDESVSSLIQNVTYNNVDSDDPTDATREVRFTVWDDAGASGDSVTAFVNVNPVNDAPRIQNIAGDSATFMEGGEPILIDEGLDGVVLDHDGPEFDGQLIIEIDGANQGEDLLDIKLTQELTNLDDVESTEGFIYLGDIEDGVVLFYDGSHVGGADWDAPLVAGGTGQLTLNLKDDADFEQISTAFIQSITYGNDADDLEDSVRTIRFSAEDGKGESSTWYEMSMFVKGVNDPPVIDCLEGDSVTFSKNDDPVLLDVGADAGVVDADTDNFNGGQLNVEIYSGVVADEDYLSISTVSGYITLANDNVFVLGDKIGTYDENGRSLEVIFTEDVTKAQASTLLQNISYENLNTVDPTAGNRTLRFTIDDGEDVNSLSDAVETVVSVEGNRNPDIDKGIIPDEWPVQLDVFNRFTINGDAFTDADNDDLGYTATLANGDPLPDWVSLSEDGTFLAVPTDEDQEDLAVIVYANDGVPHPGGELHEYEASAMMTITIADAGNAVPTFEDMSVSFMISEHQDENVGQVLDGFTVSADYQVGDPVYTVGQTVEPVKLAATDDAFGGDDALTYSIEDGGAGNFTIDPATGEIVLVATDDLDFETGAKSFTLTIRATDADGLFNEGTLTIFVQDENDDPVVAEPIPDQDVSVATFGGTSGWRYDFSDTFADPDGDGLTYTAVLVDGFASGSDESYTRSTTDNFRGVTGWLNFSSTSEIFFGIPTTGDIQTFTIDLWADDGTADPVVETFEINVIASLNMELRDALRYLDMDADELYLPVDGEDLEIHDVAMYAQASDEAAPVDADMMEALELLDNGDADHHPSNIV